MKATKLLLGTAIAFTCSQLYAQQAKQPDTAPARAQQGAQQGSAARSQTGMPNEPLNPAVIQPLDKPKKAAITADKNGIAAGSFLLFPDINLGALFDSNIYATRNEERDDWVWSLTPSIEARSNWDKHQLNASAGVTANRYQTTTPQNTDDYWVNTQGGLDITDNTNLYAGAGYSRDHEDRSSPDIAASSEPTIYHDTNAFAGVFHDFGPANVRFGAATSYLDYDNVKNDLGAVIVNDDRDRDVTTVGGRASFHVTPVADIFFQALGNQRDYRNTPDVPNGYERNSEGSQIDIGASFNLDRKIVGEIYVGGREQDYEDARLKDVSTPDIGGQLRWHISPWTTYRFSLDRSIDETVLTGASSYINTSGTASVEHELGANTVASASFTQGENEFQGISRKDQYSGAGVSIKHYLDDAIYVGAGYDFMRRGSNEQDANYGRNLMSFSIGSDFGARRKARYFAYQPQTDLDLATADSAFFDAIYLGGAIGKNNLSTQSSGPRDGGVPPGNNDAGQFGKVSRIDGLFVGIGKTYNQWYVGAELQADNSDSEWSHVHAAANPDEPLTFSVEQDDSWSASLRGGYVLKSGPLLYARAGVARTSFENTLKDETLTLTPDTTRSGTVVGIGTDIPASDNLFVRMDYSHTEHDSYHVALDKPIPDSYDEKYENSSSAFKLGVGYRFGAETHQAAAVDPTFMRGVYVGAQAGYGGVLTDLHTLHAHPDNVPAFPLNDTLDADFGNEGATGGAFLGYGYTFNRWYVAGELEGQAASEATWEHDRNPGGGGGGRDFSVAKGDSYGAAVKVGYILPNGSMLYARTGPVKTRFSTYYKRGSGSAPIDQDDTLDGNRVGIGAELPINKNAFWRVDYSMTDYDGYTFTTLQGNPANRDVVTMDNQENLFTLGLGFRF
jgi:hypothetical protein